MIYLWELLPVVEDIRESSGRIAKADDFLYYLTKDKVGGAFAELLYHTYSPGLVYGLKKVTRGMPQGGGIPLLRVWLLLKNLSERWVTGREAKLAVTALLILAKSREEQELFVSILQKTLHLGLTAKSMNKIAASYEVDFTIPLFEVMLAAKDPSKIEYPSYVEPKLDGVRIIAEMGKGGKAKLISRSGQDLTKRFPETVAALEKVAKEASSFRSVYLDGELVAEQGFRALTSRVQGKGRIKDNLAITYVIFDVLFPEDFTGESGTPLSVRKIDAAYEYLEPGARKGLKAIPTAIARDAEELQEWYTRWLAAGYEGVVVKDMDGVYEPGRSNAWIKLKPVETFDFIVLSIEEGKGLYAGITGALVVWHQGREVKVGTGMTQLERAIWWEKPRSIIGKTIEVRTQEITEDSTLKPFVFIRVREEKV